MELFFNFMRRSLILALKSDNELIFKSLLVCLFQIRGPLDHIANLVALKEENIFTVSCKTIVFYNFEIILKGFWN